MIRFSQDTFIRHAGGQSLLWHPLTGACAILEDAKPFLRHIDFARCVGRISTAEVEKAVGGILENSSKTC